MYFVRTPNLFCLLWVWENHLHAHRCRALVKNMISKILQDLRKRNDIDSLVENIKSVYWNGSIYKFNLVFSHLKNKKFLIVQAKVLDNAGKITFSSDRNDSSWHGGKGHGHTQVDVGSLECSWPLKSRRWKKSLPGMITRAAAWARLCFHVFLQGHFPPYQCFWRWPYVMVPLTPRILAQRPLTPQGLDSATDKMGRAENWRYLANKRVASG